MYIMHLRIAIFSCFILFANFGLSIRIPGGSTTSTSTSRSIRVSIPFSRSASNSSTSTSPISTSSRSTSRPKSGVSSSTSSISSLTSITTRSSSSKSRGTDSTTTLPSSTSTATSLSASNSLVSSTTASPTTASSSTASSFTASSTTASSTTALSTIDSSSTASSTTSSPLSITSHPWLTTSTGNPVASTTTICCHSTIIAFIGDFLFGGSGGGGVADVGGTDLKVPEGETDRVVEPSDGGPPELSSVSQPSLGPTTLPTTTVVSTSSSSSSTASPSPYVITPKDGVPADKEAAFQKRLEELSVEPIEIVLDVQDKVDFWVATLTPDNAAAVGSDEVVSYYYLDDILEVDKRFDVGEPGQDQSLERRELLERNEIPPKGFKIQASCKRELSMVSQPPNEPLAPLPPDLNPKDDQGMYYYNYVDSVVEDVWVYLIDDGANTKHPEYRFMLGKKAWSLLATGAIKDDPTSHGSCMLSKIAGPMYGTAKAVNVAILKITKAGEMESSSMWLKAFQKVLDHVVKNNRQGRAVISFSRSSRSRNMETSHFSEDLYKALSDLIKQDVVIVCASGNFRTSHPRGETGKINDNINSIPALFGVPGSTLHDGPLDLLVVGAVDANGVRTQYSQGPAAQLGVSAVGNSWCAYGKARDDGTQINQWLTGTSVATAQVAGQVAVMLANPDAYGLVYEPGAGKTAQKVKEIIQEAAYPRSDGEPPVLWNDVDLISCPKRPPGGLRHKRQADGSSSVSTSTDIPMCAISRTSSVTSTMPVTTTTSSSSSSSYTSCPTAPAFQNPGFETSTFGPWVNTCSFLPCDPAPVAVVDTDEPHSGSYAMDISNLAPGDDQYYIFFYLYQNITVCTSGTYTLTFWGMSNDLADCAGCCTIIPIINGQMVDGNDQISVATSYTQYSTNVSTLNLDGPTTLQIGLVDWNCYTQHLYLDDFSITVS